VNVRWWGRWFVLVSLALAPVRAAAGPVEERLADETEELQRFLELRMNRANMPGLAFGLVVDGELVWSFTGGVRDLGTGDPVGADTVFRIGSATKTVTAAAILQLRDAGSIGLDEPVAGQVPELGSVVYPTSDSPPITYRHLLTHTSGLPRVGELDYYTRPDQSVTEAELMAALDAAALEFSPGTRTRYSNLAFGLAGLAVGRASGQPFREVVAERLLAPLQMDSTVWEPEAVPPERLATGYALEEGRRVPVHHWRLGAAEGMGGCTRPWRTWRASSRCSSTRGPRGTIPTTVRCVGPPCVKGTTSAATPARWGRPSGWAGRSSATRPWATWSSTPARRTSTPARCSWPHAAGSAWSR